MTGKIHSTKKSNLGVVANTQCASATGRAEKDVGNEKLLQKRLEFADKSLTSQATVFKIVN